MIELADLAAGIRSIRQAKALNLTTLSTLAGVSVSMLSAIERAEKAPTVIVLAKIADGLGVPLSELLADAAPERVIVRRADEHERIDEADGWWRSVLTPVVPGVNFEWVRTRLPPHCDAGTFDAYAPGSHEFVYVESGTLDLTIGAQTHRLRTGDTIYFAGDTDHAYANPGTRPCTYLVAALIMRSRAPHRRSGQANSSASAADERV